MSLLIKDWLKKPDTHRLYSEGKKLFRAFGATKYPHVLSKLETGWHMTDLVHYLTKLANELPDDAVGGEVVEKCAPKIVIHAAPKVGKVIERKIWHPENDKGFFDLQKKLRHARQERMKISESFHDCNSDLDRLRVCQQLEAQTEIIKDYKARIDESRKTGQPPTMEDLKKANQFVLADTVPELVKQQRKNKDRLRRARLACETLQSEFDIKHDYRTKMKLENKEKIRKELEIRKQLIQEKLNDERKKNTK